MKYEQYINYVAVDILEVLGVDTNDRAVSTVESVLHQHAGSLQQKRLKAKKLFSESKLRASLFDERK